MKETWAHLRRVRESLQGTVRLGGLGLTSREKAGVALSSLGGAILGNLVTWLVVPILLEVTFNTFFGMYFGIVFMLFGVFLFARASQAFENNQDDDPLRRRFQVVYAVMMILAGVYCFLLHKVWSARLYILLKVPVFLQVAVCVSLCLIFLLLDLLNYVVGLCQHDNQKSLVDSKIQSVVMVGFSLLFGTFYGLLFVVDDLSDDSPAARLLKYELINSITLVAVPSVLGAAAGAANEVLRLRETEMFHQPLQDPFTQEI